MWYVAIRNQRSGPFTREEVLAQARAGELDEGALVWTEGMGGWAPFARTELAKAEAIRYGGFGIRALAHVIDNAIVSLVFFALVVTVMTALKLIAGLDLDIPGVIDRTLMPLSFALNLFYFGILQPLLAGSPGKRLCGLRLVGENRQPIRVATGVLRYLALLASWVPLGLGVLALAWHPRKQGWHDRAARTLVILA